MALRPPNCGRIRFGAPSACVAAAFFVAVLVCALRSPSSPTTLAGLPQGHVATAEALDQNWQMKQVATPPSMALSSSPSQHETLDRLLSVSEPELLKGKSATPSKITHLPLPQLPEPTGLRQLRRRLTPEPTPPSLPTPAGVPSTPKPPQQPTPLSPPPALPPSI